MDSRGREISLSAKISSDVELVMGDCSSIGDDVVVSGKGKLTIGDYVKVHRFTWINVISDVHIGHNSWIGEKSILDGTGGLHIGNNVAIGTGSQVWSHISFGDAFSGCRLRTAREVTLADEAWLAGPVMVQGVSIASRAVVLGGSNVTQDITKTNSIWSGNPAHEVTGEMGGLPWNKVTNEQKAKYFGRLLKAYEKEVNDDRKHQFECIDHVPSHPERYTQTFFEMDRRVYTKRGTENERHFMRWLLKHNKAKFTPI